MIAGRIGAIAICGPTASGKTEIAIEVAEAIGGEIVNADSRQIYRDLAIGTGVPTPEQMNRATHHLFQFVDPCERYSAGAYVRDATAAVEGIVRRGRVPIVVGGTGLYVESLGGTMPMDRAVADEPVRARIRTEAAMHGQDFLHGWLHALSPPDGARVPSGDRYRTVRALEAVLAARATPRCRARRARSSVTLQVFLVDVGSEELAARIARRTHMMFERGIADEAIALRRRCAAAPALTGFGYAESLAWRDGTATWNEAIRSTIVRTLRYAKRQRTWFRRMRACVRIDGAEPHAAARAIVRAAREKPTGT